MSKIKITLTMPATDAGIREMTDAALIETAAKINRLSARLGALKEELKRRSSETGVTAWQYADYSATVYKIAPSTRLDGAKAKKLLEEAGIAIPYIQTGGGLGVRFK